MHADYWQRTNEFCESPRAEDHSLAFRSDQERWLAPRIEERWVQVRSTGEGIERRADCDRGAGVGGRGASGGRPSGKLDGKRLRRERPTD